ncbi:hypothetical protein SLS59_007445 [Nothophoma quercina]|uniref:Uncharacterized protein n=1 Tax=Nothophoma quercina TaxID=749835 RepID=A0ABR3QZ28_9PLEO
MILRRVYFHADDDDTINTHGHILDSKMPHWRDVYTDAKGQDHYKDNGEWYLTYEALNFWPYQCSGTFNEAVAETMGQAEIKWLYERSGGNAKLKCLFVDLHVKF